jgi:hypothetical protein
MAALTGGEAADTARPPIGPGYPTAMLPAVPASVVSTCPTPPASNACTTEASSSTCSPPRPALTASSNVPSAAVPAQTAQPGYSASLPGHVGGADDPLEVEDVRVGQVSDIIRAVEARTQVHVAYLSLPGSA